MIINVRPRTLRTRVLLFSMAFGAVLMGVTMPAAKADPSLSRAQLAYVQQFHSAVCSTIADYPSEGGVAGVLSVIIDDGFSPVDAANVVNAAVAVYCPQWWPLLEAIGDKARGENQISQVWQS